jgi:hypothetical protein
MWKIRLNLGKYEIMTVTIRTNTLEIAYYIEDIQLERVSHATDLGFVFESNFILIFILIKFAKVLLESWVLYGDHVQLILMHTLSKDYTLLSFHESLNAHPRCGTLNSLQE